MPGHRMDLAHRFSARPAIAPRRRWDLASADNAHAADQGIQKAIRLDGGLAEQYAT